MGFCSKNAANVYALKSEVRVLRLRIGLEFKWLKKFRKLRLLRNCLASDSQLSKLFSTSSTFIQNISFSTISQMMWPIRMCDS